MPSRLLVLLLLLLSVTPGAGAQGQDSALLLGLRFQEPIPRVPAYYAGRADSLSRTAYYTVLITKRRGKVAKTGEVENLLIPRGNTIWRVGAKRSIYNDWVEDFIWSEAPGMPPRLPGIQAYNGEYCEGYREQAILFVGSDHLSLEQESAGYCEGAAHPWVSQTLAFVPIDSTTHLGLAASGLLGAAAGPAFERARRAFLAQIPDDEAQFDYAPIIDDANWGLIRRQGRWTVRARLDAGGSLDGGEAVDLWPAIDPPTSLVGRQALTPEWKTVRAFAPDAVDAFSSPENDLLVILHPARLTVHPLVNGVIGTAVVTLRLRTAARPVMVRWGAGPRVQQWQQRINRPGLSANGL